MEENERLMMAYFPIYGSLWFYASEVREAKSDADVLMRGRNRNGKTVYDKATAKRIAAETKGQKFIAEMRRASGTDAEAPVPEEPSRKQRGRPRKEE